MFKSILCKIILAIFIASISICAYASTQTEYYEIKGKVLNNKSKPIPYVFVSVKNIPDIKAASEIDGSFILRVPKSSKFPIELNFSSVNFEAKSFKIISSAKAKQSITIKLNQKKSANETYAIRQKKEAEDAKRPKKHSGSSDKMMSVAATGTAYRSDFDAVAMESPSAKIAIESGPIVMRDEIVDYYQPNENVAAGLLTAGELSDFAK
jgi:hypothetical protein